MGAIVVVLACLLPGVLQCGRDAANESSNTVPSSRPHGAAEQPEIRVLIAGGTPACVFAADGPFEVYGAGEDKPLWQGESAGPCIVLPGEGGGLAIDGRGASSAALEVLPLRGCGIRLRPEGAAGEVEYEGRVRFARRDDGTLDVINVLPVEIYLRGVVPNEMPNYFHREALRAQAIAARTYAIYQRNSRGRERGWDVAATESSQVYLGLSGQAQAPEAIRAVEDTRGVVCVWEDGNRPRIFCTYYSSTCGGLTQPASAIHPDQTAPPLCGNVRCDFCEESRFYRWGPERLPKRQITANLRARYPRLRELGPIETIDVVETTLDGRVTRVRVADRDGRVASLRGEDFRLAIDSTGRRIRSTHFQLTVDSDEVVFSGGQGYGHGVGMCQWGAKGLADRGYTADRILAFYFPGSGLARAY